MTTGSFGTHYSSLATGAHVNKNWSGNDGKRNFMNEYSMYMIQWNNPRASLSIYSDRLGLPRFPLTSWRAAGSNFIPANHGYFVPMSGSKWLDTIGKHHTKVAGHSFDLGQLLAEVDHTSHSLLNAAAGLLSVSRGIPGITSYGQFVRSGSRALLKKRGTSRQIRNAWLRSKYEIRPLVQDVQDGYAALTQIPDPVPVVLTTGASETYRSVVLNNKGAYTHICTDSRVIRTKVTARRPSWSTLGLQNIAGIGWERVPFSFVVDWFLPIGPWLQAMSFPDSEYEHWVSVLTKDILQFVCNNKTDTFHDPVWGDFTTPADQIWTFFDGNPYDIQTTLTRSKGIVLPPLHQTWRSLQRSLSPSLDRVVTASALLSLAVL